MYSSAYIWAKILGYLENKLTPPVVSAWFDDTEVVECTDMRLVIYSPSDFRKSMIETHAASYIKDAMKVIFDSEITLTVLGEQEMKSYLSVQKKKNFIDFNPQFTFEKFVVGSSNRFAHAAAMAVANNPGATDGYNPLFIYGPSGLGKTHLLYAIASKVHKERPDTNIVYIKGEQFTNELIDALGSGKNLEFRNKYRSADLFLVDDVQFIAGRVSTEEEYFNTFNALYESKKQIVMTADRPPREMAKLEERLQTRFEWGLLADIQPPDYETRMAILRNYALSCGIDLPNDVCSFIAENVTADVRKLEGAINILKATWTLEHMEIDMNTATRVLKRLKIDGKSVPTPQLILSEVCRFYSIEDTLLRGTQKTKAVTEARQVAMHLLSTMIDYSTMDIGRELNRDHSTVIYGCRKVKSMLDDPNSGMQDNIRDIISNINSKL